MAISLNTYREAVRARILHGLFGLAFITLGYSLVVGAFALQNEARVVADVGSASISVYSLIVAVVISASSLYRELELKTIFPILARPIYRGEYLLGKYLGTVLTIFTFIAINSGTLLIAQGIISDGELIVGIGVPCAIVLAAIVFGWKWASARTWLPIPVGVLLFVFGLYFGNNASAESNLIAFQSAFTLLEVLIVCAISLVFASFSSPFLSAIFTIGLIIIGRSADTLSKLPAHIFGDTIKSAGAVLSQVLPNLMVYVPPRAMLIGDQALVDLSDYAMKAMIQSFAWSGALLVLAIIIFRRRDFL